MGPTPSIFSYNSEKSYNNRRQYQESISFTFRFCSHTGKEKECRLYHLKDALKTYECENKTYDKKPPNNCWHEDTYQFQIFVEIQKEQ